MFVRVRLEASLDLGYVPHIARVLRQGTQLDIVDPDYALLDLPVDVSVEVVSLGCHVADDKHLALLLDDLDIVVVKIELVGKHKVSTLDASVAIENLLTPLIVVYVEAAEGL